MAAVLVVLMHYGGAKIFSYLAYESPSLVVHLSLGLAVSVVIAVILLSRIQLQSWSKLAILTVSSLFAVHALAMGYFTVIFTVLPIYYSFKFWRSDSA